MAALLLTTSALAHHGAASLYDVSKETTIKATITEFVWTNPHVEVGIASVEDKSARWLLEAAPGTRFPAHHHGGGAECYVLSGSLETCHRRMTAGDFLHAAADTDHGELWADEGCRVLLVVSAEDYLPSTSTELVRPYM